MKTTIQVTTDILAQINIIKAEYNYKSVNDTLRDIINNKLEYQVKVKKMKKKKIKKEIKSKLTIKQAKIEYYTKKLKEVMNESL